MTADRWLDGGDRVDAKARAPARIDDGAKTRRVAGTADQPPGCKRLIWRERRRGAGLPDSLQPTTSGAAVNYETAGFGGINGFLPAKRGSPPFIPPPAASPLTAAREAVFGTRAIPPKILRSATMSHENSEQLWIQDHHCGLRPASNEEIVQAARDVMSRKVRRGTSMTSPQLVERFLITKLGDLEHELFCVLLLDKRHRLIEYVELFRGTIDGASVHPREVVKLALAKNAAAVVLAHPHPSGIAEPSQADELITQRLKDALSLVDVRVLDHIVVAGGSVVSFAQRGLL
jgi:DNA repair protein RadC